MRRCSIAADFAGARDCFATAVAEYDDRERTKFWAAHTGHNAGVTHRSNLAVSLWHLGYPDQALEVNREMRQLAREIGHPFSVAYALHHTAWLYQHCRLGAKVQAAAEEEIEIATEQGFALWHATGTFFKGAGMLLQGDLDEALPMLLKGHRCLPGRRCRADPYIPVQHPGRRLHACRPVRGRAPALDEGLAIAEKNDERCQEAELHRLQGDLLLAESPDQINAAEDCFQQAIETARRQQSKGWELRATMSLARLWQGQGRRAEAHQILAAIYCHVHRRLDDARPGGRRGAPGSSGLNRSRRVFGRCGGGDARAGSDRPGPLIAPPDAVRRATFCRTRITSDLPIAIFLLQL